MKIERGEDGKYRVTVGMAVIVKEKIEHVIGMLIRRFEADAYKNVDTGDWCKDLTLKIAGEQSGVEFTLEDYTSPTGNTYKLTVVKFADLLALEIVYNNLWRLRENELARLAKMKEDKK